MSELDLIRIYEHSWLSYPEQLSDNKIHFQGNSNKLACIEVKNGWVSSGYYIGMDWLEKDKIAVYVEPKLNKDSKETDYLGMLLSCLKHAEVQMHTKDLYEIKSDQPAIHISQDQDKLTPLLIIHFLNVMRRLVKKGLKKSYYQEESSLNARVKGKLLISPTLKKHLLKNQVLKNRCRYDQFDIDCFENRLLKGTLLFIQQYLNAHNDIAKKVAPILSFCLPYFEEVQMESDLKKLRYFKPNAFYKEYTEALYLANLILRNFGYTILTLGEEEIFLPPFWIDMSKLFELYVLGLLKDEFNKDVYYHFYKAGNELDFLLNHFDYKMVIDAKYKPSYRSGKNNLDIRQVSGYSRLRSVYEKLDKGYNELIDCLIIYPNQDNGFNNLKGVRLNRELIDDFVNIFKIGIKIPTL